MIQFASNHFQGRLHGQFKYSSLSTNITSNQSNFVALFKTINYFCQGFGWKVVPMYNAPMKNFPFILLFDDA
jgi:hypothetical protein